MKIRYNNYMYKGYFPCSKAIQLINLSLRGTALRARVVLLVQLFTRTPGEKFTWSNEEAEIWPGVEASSSHVL